MISGLYNGVSLAMRSKSCSYAILNDSKENNFSCIDCNKVQQQLNVLQNIPIDPEDPVYDQCGETKELTGDGGKENTKPKSCDILRNDLDCPFSTHRLRLLKGISVLQDKGNNVKNGQKMSNHVIAAETPNIVSSIS